MTDEYNLVLTYDIYSENLYFLLNQDFTLFKSTLLFTLVIKTLCTEICSAATKSDPPSVAVPWIDFRVFLLASLSLYRMEY